MKKVLVIRYGAYGDAVIMSPIFRLLKEQGYHVTANISKPTKKILNRNPYIDSIICHETGSVKNDDLRKHWMKLSVDYDVVINLSESIERTLLKDEGHSDYWWDKAKRHEKCNKNYYDHTLEKAGLSNTGLNGELYFSKDEHKSVQKKIRKYQDKFIVLWSLSGSSFHKAYPFAEYVACEFLERHRDSVVITVGDDICTLLEWDHPRTIQKSGKWDIREVMLMTKYVDMVIGSETGILNAVGCYDTPKVILLSHSSHENLSKYWKNCTPLHADVPCYPCHQLHYTLESCPLGDLKAPICVEELKPNVVLNAMEEIYEKTNANNLSAVVV